MKARNLLIAFLLLAPPAVSANDGYGGLTATGLQFGKSKTIRMLSEDLFLSPKQVRVRYVFRNDGPKDEQGEVIFPLPPISLAELQMTGFSIPEEKLNQENAVDFIAMVNGKQVAVRTERQAILEPPWDEQRTASGRYDAPGKDVTALLQGYGLPLSFNHTEIAAMVARLPQTTKDRLKTDGLVNFFAGEPPMPQWSIIERYHWPQTFPAGQNLTIEHRYNPAPPGGIFGWSEQQTAMDAYRQELINTYCIDAGTQKALGKLLRPKAGKEFSGTGNALYLNYILTTANTWNGPIGTFHLTIDKGAPHNVLSLCMDGIRKTGPTTFEVEKKNFSPTQDLRLLIVTELDGQ